jgi:hypothetical protein
MKKLFLVLFAAMAISFSANAQNHTFYAYVETWSNGYVNESNHNDEGTAFFSDIIVVNTKNNDAVTKAGLIRQYSSALEAHLTHDEFIGYVVKGHVYAWVYTKKEDAVEKRNKAIGEDKRKGTTVKYFNRFEYID